MRAIRKASSWLLRSQQVFSVAGGWGGHDFVGVVWTGQEALDFWRLREKVTPLMKNAIYGFFSLAFVGVASCEERPVAVEKASWPQVEQAWAGAAEVSRYELKQGRYGEIQEGEATLIFVREPFLKERQVKDESGKGEFQVLKMNFLTRVSDRSLSLS